MSLTSLLYISTSSMSADIANARVDEIIDASVVNNRSHDLTGALLFTGTYFAQVLEGRSADIERLMRKLTIDDRHDNLAIVDRREIPRRRFADWNMAYRGPSLFVSRHVSRLLNDPGHSEKDRAAAWLSDLMLEFAKS